MVNKESTGRDVTLTTKRRYNEVMKRRKLKCTLLQAAQEGMFKRKQDWQMAK